MRYFLCVLLAVFVVVCSVSSVRAETNIAVVDVQYILSQSEAAKSIYQQRSDLQARFLSEISETEQGLRKEEEALLAEREKLSSDEFLKKKQAYERKLLETGRSAREKKQALESVLTEAMGRLRTSLTEIVAALAKEKDYNLVLTKQNVITGAESIDLTQEAIARLNKTLPEVKLKAP